MLSPGWHETPGETREREAANYDERAATIHPRHDGSDLREHLWLNGMLPASVLGTRFQVTKLATGPLYRMRCTDLVSGRVQEFGPGQWGFLEAWMSDQEGRS